MEANKIKSDVALIGGNSKRERKNDTVERKGKERSFGACALCFIVFEEDTQHFWSAIKVKN